MVGNSKSLTEQVEEYFRYRQSHVYHKHKTTTDRDSLWRPPKKKRKDTEKEHE
jgi:hypothetical protein